MQQYRPIISEERYMLATLPMPGLSCTEIARRLGRHHSAIKRQLDRNRCAEGGYRVSQAIRRTNRRRYTCRRRWRLAHLATRHHHGSVAHPMEPGADLGLAASAPRVPPQP